MTSKDFVTWFKGFVQAANTYNITPNQWDAICDQLAKVNDTPNSGGYTISTGTGVHGTTTTTSERRGDVTYNQDVPSTKTLLTDNLY
jgi:hypothetical protein